MATESPHDSSVKDQSASSSPAKVSLAVLIALVIGSMIGGGIFGLPSQMGAAAAPGPLIIGWLITGAGMLMLAKVFQSLAVQRPDIDAGVYGYAKEGFGNYLGFSSAWGYWFSAWMGNVGYLVLLMTAIGVFLPGFGEGTTLLATVVSSALLWLYHLLILRGIREAAVVNVVVTIAKIVPLIVFIIIGATAFKIGTFSADFWGANSDLGSTLTQVKAMMLVTVWVFIGVEGASVFSERARNRHDVGRATITGFASVLVLLLLVNLLSYGIAPREEIAAMPDPSTSGVLTAAVGPWGGQVHRRRPGDLAHRRPAVLVPHVRGDPARAGARQHPAALVLQGEQERHTGRRDVADHRHGPDHADLGALRRIDLHQPHPPGVGTHPHPLPVLSRVPSHQFLPQP